MRQFTRPCSCSQTPGRTLSPGLHHLVPADLSCACCSGESDEMAYRGGDEGGLKGIPR
ncbi:Rhamnogalacturonase A [Clarias magur]|uniref:Rhamnogalacturonase A n=1 Tax=Clarias magur TaxID=1594786 RepID=A0A8J4X356_CLAMG|nr:Rhamnogalacturonase A [Clarias magur]